MSANYKLIHFPRSDGDPTHARWPTKRDFVSGGLDSQNITPGEWFPVGLEDFKAVSWRKELGQALAKALTMGPGQCILAEWPEHYRLFIKGRVETSNSRADTYLIGGTGRVFRSRKEFIPHAIWLFGPEEEPCPCPSCTKNRGEGRKSQGVPGQATRPSSVSSATPGSSRTSTKSKQSTSTKNLDTSVSESAPPLVHAEVHAPRLISVDKGYRQADISDRLNDIRAASRQTNPVLHRKGELVWCALSNPIPSSADEQIAFWPGVVKNIDTKTQLDNEEPGPSSSLIQQATTYTIHLLAVSRPQNIGEKDVLPYQAYLPSEMLSQAMTSIISQCTQYPNEQQLRAFNPFPEGGSSQTHNFEQAAPAYALAVQIATNVSNMWSLTDAWDFYYMLSKPRDQLIPTPPLNPFDEVSHEDIVTNLLGIAPPPSQVTKQVRFQGLWWGGERIWVEDMLRLKFPRSHLAPQGASNILAPSTTTDAANQRMRDGQQIVAGSFSRGTFLKLEGIMVVDIPNPQKGGFKKDIRLCGSLYELADIDFEDPNEPPTSNFQPIYPNGSISSPGTIFPNPIPPAFSKFRCIQADDTETVITLTMLAGRYYPRLPNSREDKMVRQHLQAKQVKVAGSLAALDGTTPGFLNSVDPTEFTLDRRTMFRDSHESAMLGLMKLLRKKTPLFLPSDEDEAFLSDSMDIS